MEKEALFYNKISKKIVQCRLCPNYCTLNEGEKGKCNVRINKNGKLISLVYERPCSLAIDPIEKKPLFHFLPGKKTLSIATFGCNLKCKHCQNYEISQLTNNVISFKVKVKDVVKYAIKNKSKIISYTYTEPTIFYEYMLDICKEANKSKLRNVTVTNGYINKEPLLKLCKYIDASNIDIKSIKNEFYETICNAKLNPILESIKLMKKEGVWIELTNLIIPGFNDSDEEIFKLSSWVLSNLGDEVPLHFSAFFPNYEMLNIRPTPKEKVIRAREIALSLGLKYVYTGNINFEEGETTYCPDCKKPLIIRRRYNIIENKIKRGKCPFCKREIAGIWD
ncbi:MAG: AmmeMemoRadiSam system radical SAM enzyme [Candidatus Pacearchaeota archaeon]